VSVGGNLVAASRLTTHWTPDDTDRDTELWHRTGNPISWPVCDLGRLVVDARFRGHGIAQRLNMIRIEAARECGAKSIICTASAENCRLLLKLDFFHIGETIVFSDRPKTTFYAVQLNLEQTSRNSEWLSQTFQCEGIALEVLSFCVTPDMCRLSQASKCLDSSVLLNGSWNARLNTALQWVPLCLEPSGTIPLDRMETPFALRRRVVTHAHVMAGWGHGSVFRKVTEYEGHLEGVNCFAVHPNVLSASDKGLLTTEDRKLECSGSAILASGGFDSTVLLWPEGLAENDRNTREPIAALVGHSAAVTGVAWPREETLVSVSYDGTLKQWDTASTLSNGTSNAVESWNVHADRILALASSNNEFPSGREVFFTGGRDGRICVTDLRTETGVVASLESGDSCVYSLVSRGNLLVAGTHRGRVSLFDIRRGGGSSELGGSRAPGMAQLSFKDVHERPVMALALRGGCLLSGCKNGFIACSFLCAAGSLLFSDQPYLGSLGKSRSRGHNGGVRSICFAQQGRTIVSAGNESTIKTWDISPLVYNKNAPKELGESYASMEPKGIITSHSAQVTQVSACGASIFSSSLDGKILGSSVSASGRRDF